MSNSTKNVGMGFCGWLTITFIVLKLCGKIGWSWIWVLCPLWIPFAIAIGFLLFIILVGIAWSVVDNRSRS